MATISEIRAIVSLLMSDYGHSDAHCVLPAQNEVFAFNFGRKFGRKATPWREG